MPGSTLDKGSKVEQLVLDIRKRKGLKPEIPTLDECAPFIFFPRHLLHDAHLLFDRFYDKYFLRLITFFLSVNGY